MIKNCVSGHLGEVHLICLYRNMPKAIVVGSQRVAHYDIYAPCLYMSSVHPISKFAKLGFEQVTKHAIFLVDASRMATPLGKELIISILMHDVKMLAMFNMFVMSCLSGVWVGIYDLIDTLEVPFI